MTTVLLLTIALVGIAMLALSIGFIVTGQCLRGGCGVTIVERSGDTETVTCGGCGRVRETREICDRQCEHADHHDDDEDAGELVKEGQEVVHTLR